LGVVDPLNAEMLQFGLNLVLATRQPVGQPIPQLMNEPLFGSQTLWFGFDDPLNLAISQLDTNRKLVGCQPLEQPIAQLRNDPTSGWQSVWLFVNEHEPQLKPQENDAA